MPAPSPSDLTEGLTRDALEHLVLPMISIDEYESKISDKRAIVVAFYVEDESPASDLSSFIERSPHEILDTEISPAPTPEGRYVVFVELSRNDDFPKVILEIVGEVSNITDISDWTFVCPGSEDPLDLTVDELMQHVILDPSGLPPSEDDTDQPTGDHTPLTECASFLRYAPVDAIEIHADHVSIAKNGYHHRFSIVEARIDDLAIIADSHRARALQSILGPSYSVFDTTLGLLLEDGSDRQFIVSPFD